MGEKSSSDSAGLSFILGRRMNHNLDPPVGGVCGAETRQQLALAAAIRLEQGAVEAALGYQVIDHGLGRASYSA